MAGIKKLTNLARAYLDPDEEIRSVVKGDYLGEMWGGNTISRTGILLATDRNVVLYGKRWTGFDLEFLPYYTISSIECSKGFASIYRVSFDVYGGTVEMTGIHAASWIDHGDVEHFVSVVRRMILGDIPKSAESDSEILCVQFKPYSFCRLGRAEKMKHVHYDKSVRSLVSVQISLMERNPTYKNWMNLIPSSSPLSRGRILMEKTKEDYRAPYSVA